MTQSCEEVKVGDWSIKSHVADARSNLGQEDWSERDEKDGNKST